VVHISKAVFQTVRKCPETAGRKIGVIRKPLKAYQRLSAKIATLPLADDGPHYMELDGMANREASIECRQGRALASENYKREGGGCRAEQAFRVPCRQLAVSSNAILTRGNSVTISTSEKAVNCQNMC
jgi:hypothetical protein